MPLEGTSYSPSGIRTLSFSAVLDPQLAVAVAALVQYLPGGTFVCYASFVNWSPGDTLHVAFAPTDLSRLARMYADWRGGDTAHGYDLDFRLDNLACRLSFPISSLGMFFGLVSAIVVGEPAIALSLEMSLSYLTEAYRDGDAGNIFGDPISGMDD